MAMNILRRALEKTKRTSIDSHSSTKRSSAVASIFAQNPHHFKTALVAEVKMDVSTPSNPEVTDYLTEAHRKWATEEEQIVLGPYDYLLAKPGKDIRGTIMSAFNIWLQVPESSMEVIRCIVALLHNASLLIDDIEDNSDLRRGVPTAHKIFGVAQTINCSNYVYFLALQKLQELRNPVQALAVFTDELINLHRGQGMDIFWRDTLTTPSLGDYLQMTSNKTGGLFRLAIRLMQCESETMVDCTALGTTLGLLFQIRDDYMNLQSSQYTKAKGFCEDLSEGKFSFPITHAILSEPNSPLLQVLKQKSSDEDVKMYAVEYMREKTGSFEYTKLVLSDLEEIARGLAADLGENKIFSGLMDKLAVE